MSKLQKNMVISEIFFMHLSFHLLLRYSMEQILTLTAILNVYLSIGVKHGRMRTVSCAVKNIEFWVFKHP